MSSGGARSRRSVRRNPDPAPRRRHWHLALL